MELGEASKSSGQTAEFRHKNRLQEFLQRASIPLPTYRLVNEGYPHAPQFRATIEVYGCTLTSEYTFSTKKAAEQDIARQALEVIHDKIKDDSVPLILEGSTFCKSILYEYAVKVNLEKPTYITSQEEGLLPNFVSKCDFNGKTYTGAPAKSKKEAEQLAAHFVIESVLANSDTRTLMSEIINSKRKWNAAANKGNVPGLARGQTVEVQSQVKENAHSLQAATKEPQVNLQAATKEPQVISLEGFGNLPVVEATPDIPPAIEYGGYTYTLASAVGNGSGSCTSQANEANAPKLTGISAGLVDVPSKVDAGRKRSNMKQEQGDDHKKARKDEQLPVTLPNDNVPNSSQEKIVSTDLCYAQ